MNDKLTGRLAYMLPISPHPIQDFYHFLKLLLYAAFCFFHLRRSFFDILLISRLVGKSGFGSASATSSTGTTVFVTSPSPGTGAANTDGSIEAMVAESSL